MLYLLSPRSGVSWLGLAAAVTVCGCLSGCGGGSNGGTGVGTGTAGTGTAPAAGSCPPSPPQSQPTGMTPTQGQSTGAPPQGPTGPFYVYLITPDPSGGTGTVSAFNTEAGPGTLTGPTSTLPTGVVPSSIAAHPNGQLLYVVNNGDATVDTYQVASDGSLKQLGNPVSLTPATPVMVASPAPATVHPNGCFLYVAGLSAPGTQSTDPPQPVVAEFSIATDGSLTPLTTAGSFALPALATGPLAIEPSGKYGYVPVNDPTAGGEVCEVAIGANGVLALAQNPCIPVNGNPVEAVASPDGMNVYVVSSCITATDGLCQGQVTQYTIGSMGALTSTGNTAVTDEGVMGVGFLLNLDDELGVILTKTSDTTGVTASGAVGFPLDSTGAFSGDPVVSVGGPDDNVIAGALSDTDLYVLATSPSSSSVIWLDQVLTSDDTGLLYTGSLPYPAPAGFVLVPVPQSMPAQ